MGDGKPLRQVLAVLQFVQIGVSTASLRGATVEVNKLRLRFVLELAKDARSRDLLFAGKVRQRDS